MKQIESTCPKCCNGLTIIEHRLECSYTPENIIEIPNCPCKECLIVVKCNKICQEFIDNLKLFQTSKKIFYDFHSIGDTKIII